MSVAEGDQQIATKAKQRPKWRRSVDFLFTVAGMSVGLGNVWRFPYLCFKNGGGAFLVPYFFFAVTLAIPSMILETSLGQKFRQGLTKSWGIVPIFKGIAFAEIMIMFHSNISYPIILAWSFKYLVKSCQSVLPWSTCDNPWNTAHCVTSRSLGNTTVTNMTSSNGTASSATEYWNREVLSVTSGIDEPGNLKWDLVLYLAILWLGFYLSTFKGIGWTAKIVYVTATAPFVLIGVIMVRGLTLEGAGDGLRYYLIPDVTKLKNPDVWVAAATQVLYSYVAGNGVLTTMASFNRYHHDIWRDSVLIALVNSCASFLSGFAVFSTLGYMAHYQNTTVDMVASSGPGLAFIAYPETLSLLPLPQLWSAIFFITLLLLGFDSEFVFIESFMAFFFDNIPRLKQHKKVVRAVTCLCFLLTSLSMVTEGGVYVFEIYNNYGVAGWCMFFIILCQHVAISWCYGFERWWTDLSDMIGEKWGKMWLKLCSKYFAPTLCSVITVYYIVIHKPLTYQGYVYPGWSQVIANLMSLSSVAIIPGYAIYKLLQCWKENGDCKQLFRNYPKERQHEEVSMKYSLDDISLDKSLDEIPPI